MANQMVKIRFPKTWKSTFLLLATGGALFGFSYWIWLRLKRNKSDQQAWKTNEDSIDLPFSKGKLRSYNSASICSRVSNNDKSLSSARHQTPIVTQRTLDSDEENESSNLDCGRLGLRTLAEVVEHLELLMSKIRQYEENGRLDPSTESGQLINELRHLLEEAYHVREQYRQRLILQEHLSVKDIFENEYLSDDDTASYQSALEQIDLSEVEWLIRSNSGNKILCDALQLLDSGGIPCRALRTQLVGCQSDAEYLAKLHCLRNAFDFIFRQKGPADWLCDVGKVVGMRLLHCLDYPTSDFEEAYERMISYVNSQRNNPASTMIEELTAKGVKVINFYDVVIDLMLLEAFHLLTDPPGSVLSVTRHRLLSNSFKKVALDSAVWTILLAKRKLLKYSDGFYAHYYTLVGTLSPALAWGFLGPDENCSRVCTQFQEVVTSFLQEAFVTRNVSVTRNPTHSVHNSSLSGTTSFAQLMNPLNDSEFLNPVRPHPDGLDDADDSSTIVPDNGSVCDRSLDEISSRSAQPPAPGLRYTRLPDLSHDLYALLGLFAQRFCRVVQDECILADNPSPSDWDPLPQQPLLYTL